MTHTTQHNAATLHAALMAAAAAAPEFQNNEIGQASCDVSNASQLRAVYFDDGLIDRIHYAQRMGWKETQGEWLIQTTMEETFSELAATCDQRPSHVSVKTATGRLKLVNTRNRLQGFANEVARSKASWALWGGGNMPAELAKPRKAKPTTTWHTTSLNVCVQCFEDKHFSDGLAMALGKLGAVAYWHQDNPKNEPFLMLAPQPVEGMPARLVSGRHAIGGEWVVFDTVSGYSIKGYKAARSRAAAERAAIDTWKEKTPAQIDAALNRVTANDTTKALARLCELWKVEDAAEALADAQAKAEALAAEAEAQALAADAVAPVADAVAPVADAVAPVAADVAPVADTVAALVADAVAAVAIDAAQTTARADELAQVATVADEAACVADAVAADAVACVSDELACVADAVACMPRSEHSGQPPSHTPTGAGFATPGSSQPPASQAGKSGGQRIAGKSGKWVATFHTTPAGLPSMVYTAADGQAQEHEFASGAERMATLQRLARLADAQPATAANVAHLAAFDPSGVDVWQCSTREVQAMAEADFVALVQHLENVNHHTAALCAKCLRAGCDDLAEACTRLENAHVQAGQLTPALALARFTIGRLLRGESVNMAEAGAGSGLDACEVSEAVALVGNAYPNEKAAATPHTPLSSAADGQETPPVCAAGAPDYTHPVETLAGDYTYPVETLQQSSSVDATTPSQPRHPRNIVPRGGLHIVEDAFEAWTYHHEKSDRFGFVMYLGKQSKPYAYYAYATEAKRDAGFERHAQQARDILASKAKRKAEDRAKLDAGHGLQVGDVVRSSWGYDQTNVDHYQIIKVIGKRTVEVRALAVHEESTGDMSGRVAPVWGEFVGDVMRRQVDKYGNVNMLSAGYGRASKIDPVAVVHGVRCYAATHYSSYA